MLLRIFNLIIAIISPPLSALFWQGIKLSTQINFVAWCIAIYIFFYISAAGGILIYSLVLLHAFLLIIFRKNNGVFGNSTLNKKLTFLHIGGVLIALILTIVIFQQRTETEQNIVLDSEAIANGKQLFSSCTACHKMTRKNTTSVGPHLVGILGRKAGSLANYKYSKSMIQADFVWTDKQLIKFLQNTEEFLPGTRMVITPLLRKDASDIVTYLKSNNY